MATSAAVKEGLKVVLLCIGWYSSSSANSVIGKVILSDFPYPMTITMVQILSISLYLIPIVKLWNVPQTTHLPKMTLKYWFIMILPLSFGKFWSSVSSHISISKVTVSYAHTGNLVFNIFLDITELSGYFRSTE